MTSIKGNKTDRSRVEDDTPQRKPIKSKPETNAKRNAKRAKKKQTRKDITGTDKHAHPTLGSDHGRKKKNWKVAEARLIMEELDYHPLLEVIKIAKGEALKIDHPFLPVAEARLNGWVNRIERNLRIDSTEIELFKDQMRISLLDGWTPIDMRNKNALELLKYAHPQLKSSDIMLGMGGGIVEVRALTKKDVTTFNKWFNDNF